ISKGTDSWRGSGGFSSACKCFFSAANCSEAQVRASGANSIPSASHSADLPRFFDCRELFCCSELEVKFSGSSSLSEMSTENSLLYRGKFPLDLQCQANADEKKLSVKLKGWRVID